MWSFYNSVVIVERDNKNHHTETKTYLCFHLPSRIFGFPELGFCQKGEMDG